MPKRIMAVLLAAALLPAGALACTALYAGSGMTEDGSTVIARVEEYYNDAGWPKTFDVIPEGTHKKARPIGAALVSAGPLPMTATAIRLSVIIPTGMSARTAEERMRIRPISRPEPTARA